MSDQAVIVDAPAKVNLYLGVGPKRSDGYHQVATVFQTLDFGDRLRLEPSDVLEVLCDVDLGIPDTKNLAHCAAAAFAAVCGRTPRVRIAIEKRIPPGAGLAGGSSDAAAVIAGMAMMWGMGAEDAHLRTTAAALGSDIPFFLKGGTAFYTGRGDEYAARVSFAALDIALVSPDRPVSTAMAYAEFDKMPHPPTPGPEHMIAACATGDPSQIAGSLFNNLTDASVGLVGEIAEAIAWCRRAPGVMGVAMAGSGSAVFAICESADAAKTVADAAAALGWWSEATRTIERGVTPRMEEAS